ncbi:MAG: hypothetical protein O8C61_05560 [Candidatus Methanoperedens sp.]|nr:hypothetical protein [Candidatus Methanoperedens sp.]
MNRPSASSADSKITFDIPEKRSSLTKAGIGIESWLFFRERLIEYSAGI